MTVGPAKSLAFTPERLRCSITCNISRVMIFVVAFLLAALPLFRRAGMGQPFLPVIVAIEDNCINAHSRTSSLTQPTSLPTGCVGPPSSDCKGRLSLESQPIILTVTGLPHDTEWPVAEASQSRALFNSTRPETIISVPHDLEDSGVASFFTTACAKMSMK